MTIKLIFILILNLSLSQFSFANERKPLENCDGIYIDWKNYQSTVDALRLIFRKENFEMLEKKLYCLTDSSRYFVSGEAGSSAAYRVFRKEIFTGVNVNKISAKISAWKSQIPGSSFIYFAKARLKYAEAWGYRGTRYANYTPKEQIDLFQSTLAEAERAVLSSDNPLKGTAISNNLLLAIILDSNQPISDARTVFDNSVKKWPRHFAFYELILSRIVPKWGGSWQAVDQFISFWSKQKNEPDDVSMYARLYYGIHKSGYSLEKTKVNLEVLKTSLVSLNEKFPSTKHKIIAASYACHYKDYQAFMLFSKELSSVAKQRKNYWLKGTTQAICDSTLTAKSGH